MRSIDPRRAKQDVAAKLDHKRDDTGIEDRLDEPEYRMAVLDPALRHPAHGPAQWPRAKLDDDS